MVDQITYREQARVFIGQAHEELALGDLYQASEKGWGAASQMVKAAADHYGWPHNAHRLLLIAATQMQEVTGDEEFPRLFASAQALHTSFYEGNLNSLAVEQFLADTSRFVDKVDALLPRG